MSNYLPDCFLFRATLPLDSPEFADKLPPDVFIFDEHHQQQNYSIWIEGQEWFLFKEDPKWLSSTFEITQDEFIKGKLNYKVLKTKVQDYFAILNFKNETISVGCKTMTIENARILRDKITLKSDDFAGRDWFEDEDLEIDVDYKTGEIVICDEEGPIGYSFYITEFEDLMTEMEEILKN